MLYKIAINLTRRQKRAILLSLDLLCIAAAFFMAQMLTVGLNGPLQHPLLLSAAVYLPVLLGVGAILTSVFGLHRMKLNAYEMQGVVDSTIVAMGTAFSGVMVSALTGLTYPPAVFAVFAMLVLILTVMSRLTLREILIKIYRNARNYKKVLIYGAGQTGQQLAAALTMDDCLEPIGFVDDNPTLQSLTIAGLKVHSPQRIRELFEAGAFHRIVLAMPSENRSIQSRIVRNLRDLGCEVHSLPSFANLVGDEDLSHRTVPIDLSDLLGRNGLESELPGGSEKYLDRRILLTGAGGSIGSELCRQLVDSKPACLVLLDHSELALYSIERELRLLAPDLHIVPVLGSITEDQLVRSVLQNYAIDSVLHAAAYKHVPLVEANCIEGVRNNVIGTKVLAEAARAAKVEQFILISSDKAVRPTSVMGSTKRMAELIVQDLATRSAHTRYSIVRFGNVLGSSGSVIPLFESQIESGGPVTLTHSDVTRYFMTISEAVRLVLLAGSFARGGDVFVLDMGDQVQIRKVAEQMIEGAGYTIKSKDNPDGDIEVIVTGLRPGEKLREELLIGSDMLTTPHNKILRAQEQHLSEIEIANAMQDLRKGIELRDEAAVRVALERWVEKAVEEDRSLMNV